MGVLCGIDAHFRAPTNLVETFEDLFHGQLPIFPRVFQKSWSYSLQSEQRRLKGTAVQRTRTRMRGRSHSAALCARNSEPMAGNATSLRTGRGCSRRLNSWELYG